MTFASHIEPDEINALPSKAFEGRIHLINSPEEADVAVSRLLKEEILGFDTETRPSFKKGKINQVSLLQLATREDAYLFRINKIGTHQGLCSLFGNESVMKVGAAIRDDIRLLKKVFPCELTGFVDLQEVVKDYGIENFGVKKLAGIVLGIRISKSQQLSNWEAPELTEAQQVYAATDAWVTLEVYLKLRQTVIK
jgi:ribonuclease D